MVNWSNVSKEKKEETKTVSARLPKKYKDFIKKQNINVAKLIMRACEDLDNSLKS